MTTDMHEDHGRVDQRRRDLATGLDVPLDVVGQLIEHHVEVSGQLGGLEDADVVVAGTPRDGPRRPTRRCRPPVSARSCRGAPSSTACPSSPREITSRASMIGMPALMKTPSWREKCMMSLRGTVFLVISNCRTLFFSRDLEGLEPALEQCEVGGAGRRCLLDAGDLSCRHRRVRCSETSQHDRLAADRHRLVVSKRRCFVITSATVVMSWATRLMASSRSVRMPCFWASRRSSSWVAQPTIRRLISGVICSSS